MHPITATVAQAVAPSASRPCNATAADHAAVLLVHEDALVRRHLAQALRAAQFIVQPVACAETARDCVQQRAWAAAVLQTPQVDSPGTLELCRMLRTRSPGLPLLQLLPAHGPGQPFDADASLSETAPSAAIAATLQGLVRAHRAEEQLRAQQAAWHARQAQAHHQAHALRNPLNAILMSAQVLARMPLPPAARRAVDAICRNAQTQAHLIADTLQAHRAPSRDEDNADLPPR